MPYISFKRFKISTELAEFVEHRVLPGLDMEADNLWIALDSILNTHMAENQALLDKRDELQQYIDDWHNHHAYHQDDLVQYKRFLSDIGYLVEEGDDFSVSVENVDSEISSIAAPQLVVPINNARFAINAANARWGSLYDALYGTDMIVDQGETAITKEYNRQRGEKAFSFCAHWLDEVLPLSQGSHSEVIEYKLTKSEEAWALSCTHEDESVSMLRDTGQFKGYRHDKALILLFVHHDLHLELHIDKSHPTGAHHQAGLKDIILEAAVTTIQDCEDSIAAVDVEDKLLVYANWLGLIKGSLTVDVQKAGTTKLRKLNPDRHYSNPLERSFSLPGKSLMLVRNTGLHMHTDLVMTQNDESVPEGIIDAFITILISMHDLKADRTSTNSRTGSIYIVKPKMHGPEEVAFSCRVFADIEKALGLPENTVKIGIMDEERRTTVNLKECIRVAKERVIFINTGFLDRTADEIHTSMEAGPVLTKADIKTARWMDAYENWNIDTGLACGLDGVAQIGKGMWAMPDRLKEMYESKRVHPESGANCAWVPSPTAATLHALHYHEVSVKQRQQELKLRERASLDDILSIPLLPKNQRPKNDDIQQELDNNAQGILGYVVKWINMGVGCSKVPDIHDTGLMEDRATLRISSQHMANWLRHGLCNEQQVIETFRRMAIRVDRQNAQTPGYINMAPDYDGAAFKAALDLVLQGTRVANGYTEGLLHRYRRKVKFKLNS